ncbi:MAG TPA: hypothetical protein VM901_03570 [Bdellovibrionota bacterium]|jgi:predicted Zn-dependent peptidase|nr:hypothetical protein [Bdellovibrionota bacterium]
MMKNVALKFVTALAVLGAPLTASAKIYLDSVKDPLPLVEVSIVIPRGANNSDLKNFAAASIVDFVLESGTKARTKQELNDQLSAFGANMSMSIGTEFSYLNVSFPYLENKNYEDLFKILTEAFREPRFDKATFELAKKKLRSATLSMLDNDMSLARSMVWDWQFFKAYGRRPMTIEDIDTVALSEVQAFYNDKLLAAPDAWVGLVSPPQVKDKFAGLVAALLKKQGAVSEGEHLAPMINDRKAPKKVAPSKTFLVIDKKDRTQNVFAINTLVTSEISASNEFDFRFANYLLIGARFGSVFYDVIRHQNGFSYNVTPFDNRLMGVPSFGFVTNPVAARAIDAYKTIGDLVENYYENSAEGFGKFDDKFWTSRLQSYKYSEIMGRSSEVKKLMRRKLVVLGEISPAYYKSEPNSWKVDKKDVLSTFTGLYDKSQVVAAAIGDGASLESLVKLNFPGYQVIKIPYQDTISSKIYK